MAITHSKVSAVSDSGDSGLVQPSNWNANHSIDLSDYAGTVAAAAIDLGDEDLDTYDEGTWTPALTFATPGDLSVAYTANDGTYTRTGRVVICHGRIVTSTFTHGTASGALRVTGLPFTVATAGANTGHIGAGQWGGWTDADARGITLRAIYATTYAELFYSRSGGSIVQMASGDWPTGGSVVFHFTITYHV